MMNAEYVFTNAVIDPITKNNIETYIVKDNTHVVFNLLNNIKEASEVTLHNYYYRMFRSKNIKIRCLDTLYFGGTAVEIIPQKTYNVLKLTNKLDACLFIFQFNYSINKNGVLENKEIKYAFKIVSEKEYDMYKNMEKPVVNIESGEIKRPRKKENR